MLHWQLTEIKKVLKYKPKFEININQNYLEILKKENVKSTKQN